MVGFQSDIPTLFVGPSAGEGTTGDVGIGTASPSQKLQVDRGNILVRGVDNFNAAGKEAIMYFGDPNHYIKSVYGSGLSISTYFSPDLIYLHQGIYGQPGSGYVGIGTTLNGNPGGYKLLVEGKVAARGYVATLSSNWSDFVFAKEYELMPLTALESYVNENKHLPDVPSADEVKQNGINLGEMDATLLQKVEELTLYLIDLKKENEQLKNRISNLENKINR